MRILIIFRPNYYSLLYISYKRVASKYVILQIIMDIIKGLFTPKNAIIGLVILFILILVYIFVPRSGFHGGGGRGHWSGGRGRWGGGRGGWWGGWNGLYYPYYYDNTYIAPDTAPQKIGYAISEDGNTVLDIMYGGSNLYMYSNNGTIIKTEKRSSSPQDGEKLAATVNGNAKTFVVHLI